MRPLKPSMKEKKRYLLLKGKNLKENTEKSILEFIGIHGMSKTGLNWIKVGSNSAILCVNREMVNKIRASVALSSSRIVIERVSGTIKGLK